MGEGFRRHLYPYRFEAPDDYPEEPSRGQVVASAHAWQEHVLARLIEQFWIPKARSVRSIIRTCIGCRKRQAGKMTHMMAGLPRMRVTPYDPPFTRTGVDYFEPMMVKRGRSVVKRWGALFTCLNVRVIHNYCRRLNGHELLP